ncbi:MAG: hypothetical protein JWP96_1876 [Polaromonas sp.]|nr:hypothetical protein [Polaromonas sp.]
MGSSSSGNHGGKRTTSDMLALDVRKLQRDGLLKPERSISLTWSRNGKLEATIDIQVRTDSVTLDYRQRKRGGEWQAMKYPVRLAWTPCTYGGQRVWWLCPAVGCGRRVAVLYGGSVFACRHCQKLAYKSQRETPNDRAYRRANNLRDRLGWVPGVIHGAGVKPKGMHWRTYWRLRAIHDANVMQTLAGMSAKLKKMGLYSG